MSTQANLATDRVIREGNVFRKTHAHSGRKVAITPANSSMRHLCYAHIKLNAATPEVSFNTEKSETALICLVGQADVSVGAEKFTLAKFDAAYIPRAAQARICAQSADLAEVSAEVAGDYPLQVVRYAEIRADKPLHFISG